MWELLEQPSTAPYQHFADVRASGRMYQYWWIHKSLIRKQMEAY